MTDLPACFETFERSAIRLEVRPEYDVPAEAASLEAFRLGQPLPERSVRTSPWLARIRQTTGAGKTWSRTRVVGRPLTPYERFQLGYGYPPSAEAGQGIRNAGRAEHPELAALGGDFWPFHGDTPAPFAALRAYRHGGAHPGSQG